jgi:hypothetical protein
LVADVLDAERNVGLKWAKISDVMARPLVWHGYFNKVFYTNAITN